MPGTKSVKSTGRRTRPTTRPSTDPDARDLGQMPINDVWEEYQRTQSQTIRNFFMEKYLPLVRYNAERIHARLPDEVDIEDLMSAGLFGLMDAIDGFDLERGVKFETYCATRIRGAILDELRAMDWVPRLVRHRTAKVEQARSLLTMQSGCAPTDKEIAQQLGVSTQEYAKLERDSQAVGVVSIHRKWCETDSSKDVREIDVIRDETQTNPLAELQKRDLRELITRGLSRAERLIVILYYYEEMTMKEIGLTLDLSESRVSQMHSSILARLRAQMQHRAREFEEEPKTA
jgi:RNA polymerase sigma factor for flagellar operon FliA